MGFCGLIGFVVLVVWPGLCRIPVWSLPSAASSVNLIREMLWKRLEPTRLVLWPVVMWCGGCAPLGSGYTIHVGELAADSYEAIEFAGVPFGYTQLGGVRIGNVGTGVLAGEIRLSQADTGLEMTGFTVSPSTFVLDVDERLDVSVSYYAQHFDDEAAVLTLSHDGVGPAVSFDCVATTTDDADADGYAHEANGGDDCNDRNAYVHPGASEVWYDGVDQDCDSHSDYDADFDGYDRLIYGGLDCDDSDAEIYPGAKDVPEDGVDQDCDGVE